MAQFTADMYERLHVLSLNTSLTLLKDNTIPGLIQHQICLQSASVVVYTDSSFVNLPFGGTQLRFIILVTDN